MTASAGREIVVPEDEFIVTKTDTQGKITYANRVFMRIANYREDQLLNQNHNIIRHPDMPRGVFYGLWKTLKEGREFFGFVKNATADGDYYWVFANITPDYKDEELVGYFSVRRTPSSKAKQVIEAVYEEMLAVEKSEDRSVGPQKSWDSMVAKVREQNNMGYSEFVVNLFNSSTAEN